MLRRLGGCAVAFALLLPAQVVAAQPAASQPDQRAAATKTREVRLGHPPVRATTADTVRLTFKGRRGQLVNLARIDAPEQCGGRVLRTDGRVVRRWAQGYWKLPRTATYTVVNKPCARGKRATVRLQIRRVVRHDVLVPGTSIRVGASARVTHLVPVTVGADRRITATSSAPVIEIIRPDRSISHPEATHPEAIQPVMLQAADRTGGAGRHWLALEPRSSLETALAVLHGTQVDGHAFALPALRTAATTHEAGFAGQAGQWVYAELLDATGSTPSDTSRRIQVLGPDGVEVQTVVLTTCAAYNVNRRCTLYGPWRLPASGLYTMTLSSTSPGAEQATTLRIRAAAIAPDLTVNGPAVTYASTSPGQWVVGTYPDMPFVYEPVPGQPDAYIYRGSGTYLEASNVSPSLSSWLVTATSGYPHSLHCDESSGNGCYDYTTAHLAPETSRVMVPSDENVGPSWAVLAVPPTVQGSLTLALTRP